MRIYISVDMEGINGINTSSQCLPQGLDYQKGRKLMVEEINAAVEGAIEGGATRVVVNDAHNTMTNIETGDLSSKAELLNGNFKPLSMMEGIDEGFDGTFFIGYHAGAGTSKGVLGHTFVPSRTFRKVKINEMIVNEAILNGFLSGHFNVPVKLLTGDKWALEQSKDLLQGTKMIPVKEGRCMFSALNYPRRKILEDIKTGAYNITSLEIPPIKVELPVTFWIEMGTPAMVETALLIPLVKQSGDLSVEFTMKNYLDSYKMFLAISKLASQVKNETY